ncbi:IS66 family insertion sequence element accessory protein TnpA [Blautia faecis]|uniref:IS66 family insertion sequence element accessory protein TnpA n=1 Tax=Blautia faecis TaxID=871665 RepID=UPI003A7F5DEE
MKRHPRRSDEEWLNIIHECRTSGLSDKIWCEEHHIQPSKFYYHMDIRFCFVYQLSQRMMT